MLWRAARRGNRETKRICAVGKLTGGTGWEKKRGKEGSKRKKGAAGAQTAAVFPKLMLGPKSGV